MLNRFLICNQYEISGNFDSIRNMEYFQELAATHGKELLSDDNLYRMLGYKEIGNLSISDTVRVRRILMTGDDDSIINVLRSLGEDTFLKSCVFDFVKKHNLKDFYKTKIEHKVCPASDMLAQYLMNTNDILCSYKGVKLPYNEYVNLRGCRSKHDISDADAVKKSIRVVETNGFSHVVNGTAFVNKKDLGSFRKPQSIVRAATNAINRRKEFLADLGLANITEIASMWARNTSKYTWLLDYAASLGMTLFEFLVYAGVGIVIIDQRPVFEEFCMGMYTCGGSVFYVVPGDRELRKTSIDNINSAFSLRDMNMGFVKQMSSF